MATPTEVAEAHYVAQARQGEAAAVVARRLWRQMDADDLDRSWSQIVQRLTLSVGAAQLGAARAGAAYVPLVLAAAGADPEVSGEVNPNRWAGVASDGRPLDSLLYSSVVRTRVRLAAGASRMDALESGRKWLDAIAKTQVSDAARGAGGVAITARKAVGYVRFVSPPCCKDCAILAGRWYRWSSGFARHYKCDCRHLPATEGDVPEGYRSRIDPSEIHDLTDEQRQAVADGADLNQVVNSGRRQSSDRMTTSEGTTRRGLAGSRLSGQQRLTPEAIYRTAATREEAVDLLRRHGYLI